MPVTPRYKSVGLAHRAAPSLASAMASNEHQESLRLHLADEYRNHFHITVSIFKGITLGAAAYSLLAILAATGTLNNHVQFTALSFWIASFIGMMLTYDALMLNSLITIAAPNVVDLMIPFLYGITEFSLFPILAPAFVSGSLSRSSDAALTHLAWWPLGVAVLGLVSSLYMINCQSALAATLAELPPHLQSFIRAVKGMIRQNQLINGAATVFYLAAFFVLRFGVPHVGPLSRLVAAGQIRHWEALIGLFAIFGSTFGIWTIEQMKRQLSEALRPAPDE